MCILFDGSFELRALLKEVTEHLHCEFPFKLRLHVFISRFTSSLLMLVSSLWRPHAGVLMLASSYSRPHFDSSLDVLMLHPHVFDLHSSAAIYMMLIPSACTLTGARLQIELNFNSNCTRVACRTHPAVEDPRGS